MRRLLLLYINIAFCLSLSAQPSCDVKTYGIRDGLAASIISGMGQDGRELMWFSTWNGLCCFDNYDFITFRDYTGKDRVLTSNRMLVVRPNSQNDVWCSSYERKVYLFDSHARNFIDVSALIQKKTGIDVNYRNYYPLANGHTWIVTNNEDIALRIDDRVIRQRQGIEYYGGKGKKLKGAIRKVYLDATGREWLCTTGGVQLVGNDIKGDADYEYLALVGNNMYMVSGDGKMGVYSGGHSVRTLTDISGAGNVNAMYQYDDTRLMMATNSGLVIYDINNNKAYTYPTSTKITELYKDSKNRIWAFSDTKGVYLFETDFSQKWLNASAPSQDQETKSERPLLVEDKYGVVWVAPTNGTFAYYDEARGVLVPYILASKGFAKANQPTIDKYFVDKNKNLWFTSTHDLTLVNFKYRNFRFVPLEKNRNVRAVYQRSDGRVGVGLDNGVIAVLDADGTFRAYADKMQGMTATPQKLTTRVYAFFEDSKGRRWTATKGDGLFMTTDEHGIPNHYKYDKDDPYSLSTNDIYDVFEDNEHNVWVAGYGGGLNLVETAPDGKIRFINRNNRLKNYPKDELSKVRRITGTKDGVILLSTNEGLVTFSSKFSRPEDIKFHLYTCDPRDTTSLTTSDVMQTLVASTGDIYVVTMSGGLQKITSTDLLGKRLTFTTIRLKNPQGGIVQSIVEDLDGNLWVPREASLEKYNPQTGEMLSFGDNEFGGHIEFSEAEPTIDARSGNIFLGAMDGVIVFNPQMVKKSDFNPQIVFSSVHFQGEPEVHPILYTNELDIPSDKRNLTISFAALDYQFNRDVQYAYMIEGIDKDWVYCGNRNSASYNRLPAGHLKMMVKSTNADGQWSDNVATLYIYSHPTFWETIWAKLLYLLIIGLVVLAAVYMYLLKKRSDMEKEMNDMKTKFYTQISHKLRTPLTLIGGPVSEVLATEKLSDAAKQHLEMVQRNSRRMLDLVNRMLEHSSFRTYFVDDDNAKVFAGSDDASQEIGEEFVKQEDTNILVVEDNDDLRAFLVSILSQQYNVIEAENGKVGLEKAVAEQPDFILTDVMMPVMDGLTMVHQIKQNKDICHIPVVVLSAKASLDDRLQGLSEGIDDYITKPFSATYLRHRIENIITQRRQLQQNLLNQLSEKINKNAENIDVPGEKTAPTEGTTAPAETVASASGQATAASDSTTMTSGQATAASDQSAASGQTSSAKDEYRLSEVQILDTDKEMMTLLMEYLEQNISNSDLVIEDLADAVNLSRTVFYSKVRSIVGMSPIEFVRHVRIERGKEMIEKTNLSFSQIAYSVGFSDPRYFGKCFKKEMGLTPSEYRAQL